MKKVAKKLKFFWRKKCKKVAKKIEFFLKQVEKGYKHSETGWLYWCVQSDKKTWHDQKQIDKDKYKDKYNDKDILRTPPKSNPRDLWPLRHLFRVMRRHDMTKKIDKDKYKDKDNDNDNDKDNDNDNDNDKPRLTGSVYKSCNQLKTGQKSGSR